MTSPLSLRVCLVCSLAVSAASVRATAAPEHATDRARASTLVVLVPGFLGHDDSLALGAYFIDLEPALNASGFDTVTLAPPPVATSEERGAWLASEVRDVRERTRAAHVIAIAHSQGGVDVRVALDLGAPLDAVATLSSPHHGTDVADVALTWPRALVRAALYEIGRGEQVVQSERLTTPAPEDALASLSTAGMRAFNERHPEARVPLFTVAAFSGADVDDACADGAWARPRIVDSIHPSLLFGRAMIRSQRSVSDDGVVPTRSMRFGTFLGCVAADHHDWLGWGVRDDDDLDAVAFIVELARGLDDVARTKDAGAMRARTTKLAALANARPL